jgi:G3E family GTPase
MTIPVTILSGPLGAGKTTLLNHLLTEAGDRNVAVLVNDMGEVNVDADLVSRSVDTAAGEVTELSNGCICCELQDDLNQAVVRLAQERDFDYLVVESSGISEPGPVAKLFTTGSRAAALYDVDALVTVIDSQQFHATFAGGDVVRHGPNEEGEKPLSDLLVEQVELSNVVLLNKADLLTPDELDEVEELVRSLRPDAETIRTTYAQVPLDRILDRDLYEPGVAAERAGWRVALDEADAHSHDHDSHGDHSHDHDDSHEGHSHPMAEYGVASFVYRRRRPFDPNAVATLLADLPDDVVRSKGTLWVAGRPDVQYDYSQAGPSVHVTAAGPWIASLPEFEQDAYRRNRDIDWDDEYGDRRNELVFIGRMDRDEIEAALDGCLCDPDADVGGSERFPTDPEERLVLAEP